MSTVYSFACVTCEEADHSSRTYTPALAWAACIVVRAGEPVNAMASELDMYWLENHVGHDVRVMDEYGSLSEPVPEVALPAAHSNVRHRRRWIHWTERENTPPWTTRPEDR